MQSDPPSRRPALADAFSLVELIGVLAVMTILALALVPVVMQTLDRAARDREARNLESLGAGLEGYILRSRSIPDHTTFAQAIAGEIGWYVGSVQTNERHLRRVYLIDPGILSTLPMPFVQGPFGVTNLIHSNLGVLFLSSVGAPLPDGITSGFASDAAAFSNIWNVADGQVPAGWTWKGRGEDLRVRRLNLDGLFVPLILNYDPYSVTVTNLGRFTIDSSTTNVLPTSPIYSASYLKGTVVGLHHHANMANTLQVAEVLQHPASFIYERDTWRGQLFLGRGMRLTTGLDLQAAHDLFVASPLNANAQGSPQATPALVINAASNYMIAFLAWNAAGYPAGHNPTYDAVSAAQSQLESISVDLLHKPSGH